jgi:hypothetical protein
MLEPKKPANVFGEWCQMTGWHGWIDFYVTQNIIEKAIWLILVLLGCFFAVNQSIQMIMDFAKADDWITNTFYEMPSAGYLEWPNVTICALNWPDYLSPPNVIFETDPFYDSPNYNESYSSLDGEIEYGENSSEVSDTFFVSVGNLHS